MLKILLVVFMERKYFSKLLLVPFIFFFKKRNVQDEFKMMSFLFFEIVVLKAIF